MQIKPINPRINNLLFMDCTHITRRCQTTEYTECEVCNLIFIMTDPNEFKCDFCKHETD